MSSHLKTTHAQAWERGQLPALLAVSEGPADESKPQPCPFCEAEHPVKRLMAHVAGHLEDLSLFVLPRDGSSDPVEVESSGILSSLDSAKDDISYAGETFAGENFVLPMDIMNPDRPIVDSVWGEDLSRVFSASTPTIAAGTENTHSGYLVEDQSPSPALGTVETDPRPLLTCEECGRTFDQIHKLKYERPYILVTKQEKIANRMITSHHKRYHDRKHTCPHSGCDKRFGTKTHLDRHIYDKHLIVQKYHCSVEGCPYFKGGKAFPRRDNWRRHMQNKHELNIDVHDIPDDLIVEAQPIVS